MFRNVLISGLLSFLFVAPTVAQETLRWKFEPETQWRVAFEQQSDIVTTVSSKSTTMTVHSGMELAWKIMSVEPSGNAVISQKLQQFRI